jgi:arylsulfatase A-like enzyme
MPHPQTISFSLRRTGRGTWLALIFAGLLLRAHAAPPPRPNILILLADDQGWNDVGWRNPTVKTPNLDRFCAESLRLDNQYVCPMCTPTRVALLTGRFPQRFGISTAQNEQACHFGTETMASALKSVGYETAIIGKWHLGSSPDWGPQRFGFDYSYGVLAGGCGPYSHLYKAGEFEKTWHRNGKLFDEEGHVTDLIGREAVRWLEAGHDRPFFLYVAFTAPHVPIDEPAKYTGPNAGFTVPAKREYYASVTHMDAKVGEIMAALDRSGQRANTIVLFLSDNGAIPDQANDKWLTTPDPREKFTPGPAGGSNAPLRGRKTQVYDGGIRVPAFINWPGHLAAGVYPGVLHAADWMPTFTALAGYAPKPDLKWDGQDIWRDLTAGRAVSRDLYWVSARFLQSAVRSGDWKLVVTKATKAAELYNLARDPGEEQDLAAAQPAKVQELRDLMARLAVNDNDAKVGDAKPE